MLALAAGLFTFTAGTASAALPKIKTKARLTLAVELQATPEAPEGVAGSAVISIKQKNARQDAQLRLDVDGLPAGTYSVDGSNAEGESINLAVVQVAATKGKGKGSEIKLVVPDEVDARSLTSLSVSDSTSTVLLTGEATTSTRLLRYFANVRVTAPMAVEEEEIVTPDTEVTETTESTETSESTETTDPVQETETEEEVPAIEPAKVHGHVLIHSTIAQDKVKKSKFLFVGHGAPVSATLTINVDGAAVGTVVSTAEGKVKFTTLPAELSLPAIRVISITDALGAAVMQAQF